MYILLSYKYVIFILIERENHFQHFALFQTFELNILPESVRSDTKNF